MVEDTHRKAHRSGLNKIRETTQEEAAAAHHRKAHRSGLNKIRERMRLFHLLQPSSQKNSPSPQQVAEVLRAVVAVATRTYSKNSIPTLPQQQKNLKSKRRSRSVRKSSPPLAMVLLLFLTSISLHSMHHLCMMARIPSQELTRCAMTS